MLFRPINLVHVAEVLSRREIWPWACIAFLAIAETIWLSLTPLQLADGSGQFLFKIATTLAIGLFLARYFQNRPRVHCLTLGLTFLITAWPALRLLNHLTMTLDFPLADNTLSQWDRNIGFDWFAYIHFVDKHDLLRTAMAYSYSGLTGYSCILFVCLALGPAFERRCREMIELFLVVALVCMAIGMTFPALTPMAYYAPSAGTFEHFNHDTGTYHLAALNDLRSNPDHVFDFLSLPGLITIPSFHTAMGIIAIYCSRGAPWLFVPMLVINLVMISSTPVFGSHYGVDIIAGAAISILVILAYRAWDGRTVTHRRTNVWQTAESL